MVDVKTRRVHRVEALLRWRSPLGACPPTEFIPIAEDSGAIVGIGRWVLETACAQLAAWQAAGQRLTMAINVSARELREAEFAAQVQAALARHGIAPGALELELTESQLLGSDAQTGRSLATLEALGVRLAIDDFGAGFSSLSYLARLSIDAIKIDRALTQDLERPEGRAVASAIVAMAASLGVDVVAEGVETEAQHAVLLALGCASAQGYLYGRPLPAPALSAAADATRDPARRTGSAVGR